ncbi:MAG: SPASM domain-containing protein, partial [Deltaproteobacteria bacterium]|nr:SPASM domain-containing protein [Deltaproteobacteria bacterium]
DAPSAEPPVAERPRVTQLAAYWTRPDAFGAFRTWRDAAEPCASCSYHELCRGGCKVVSAHVLGDLTAPDPECPRVLDHGAAASAAKPRHHLPVI